MVAKVHAAIPMSRHLDFQVLSLAGDGIRTIAALKPNINIHDTAFAGSLYSLGALTAWSYTQYLIEHHGLDAELVIANAEIRYAKPITSDIECNCHAADSTQESFIKSLSAGRRSKLELTVSINGGRAELHALMVATPAG
jgi:thioesterase domain-containing protein